jgi:hypothetical protein
LTELVFDLLEVHMTGSNDSSKEITAKYFIACYSLIQDKQYNLNLLSKDKKVAFKEWLNSFSDNGIKEIDYSHKRHFSITCKEYSCGKYYMQFAKHKGTTVTRKTKDDFIPSPIDDYPYCKIFINTERNTLLIERNNAVANSVQNIIKLIEGVIRKDLCNMGYSIAIELITKPVDFWNYLTQNNGNITSVEFTLVRPNFLEGFPTATDFVNGFSNYNVDSVTTRLENSDGNLCIQSDNAFINDALRYSSSGAGKWSISAKGKSHHKSSEDNPIFFDLPEDISSLTDDKLIMLNDFFNSIDNILEENKGN